MYTGLTFLYIHHLFHSEDSLLVHVSMHFNTHLFGKFLGHQWKINIQCYLVIPPPFGPEKSLAVSEGGGTMREHSYAWTRELAMNLLNGKDDKHVNTTEKMHRSP
jgi:hypothetical protein